MAQMTPRIFLFKIIDEFVATCIDATTGTIKHLIAWQSK